MHPAARLIMQISKMGGRRTATETETCTPKVVEVLQEMNLLARCNTFILYFV